MPNNALVTIQVYPEVAGFPLLQEFSLTGGGMVQLPAATSDTDDNVPIYVQVTLTNADTDPLNTYSVDYSITPVSGTPTVTLVQNRGGSPVSGHDTISDSDIVAYYSDCIIVGETTGTQSFKITAQLKKNNVNVGAPLSTTAAYGSKIYSTSMSPSSEILKNAWDGTSNPPPANQSVKYFYEVTQASDYGQKIQCQTYLRVINPINEADQNPPTLPIVYADTTVAQLTRVPAALFSQANDVNFLGQDGTQLTTQEMGVVYTAETNAASGQVTYTISPGQMKVSIWMTAEGGVFSVNFASNDRSGADFLFFKPLGVGSGGTLGTLNVSSSNIVLNTYPDSYVYVQKPDILEGDQSNAGVIIVQTADGAMSLGAGPNVMSTYLNSVPVPLTALLGSENYIRLVERANTLGTAFKYSYAWPLTTEGTFVPRPLPNVIRTYDAPTIPVSGTIDWYSVRNGLDVTVTFDPQIFKAGDTVLLNIYLDGYVPGTDQPKGNVFPMDYVIQSGDLQYVFHIGQHLLINYAFSTRGDPGYFFADYQLKSNLNVYSKVLGANGSLLLNTIPGDG